MIYVWLVLAVLFGPPVLWLLGMVSWPLAFAPLIAAGAYAVFMLVVAAIAKRSFKH